MCSYTHYGAFDPEELGALQSVFDELTAQPWFDASDEARESFARYLFDTFADATFDPAKHRFVVESSARMFYAKET
ncbi:hypothetical protein [Shinella oryzae]|jgi:hypothetical protein|uniref:Uncharacterized protein n=1 Tax=Shinella oryzae TaxID=2871820 RepID=A0ABY9KB44_9HYPH|nr:hypothetical protein [Shinella oryzae]MDP9587813.1 hypothetical protein [Shinella zoogloeoides]WLS05735.1 hypothetical protein Q9315_17820 [Shinella oryzae]